MINHLLKKSHFFCIAGMISGLYTPNLHAALIDIGTLGGAQSFIYDISGDGSVIVGSSNLANGERRAFKYTTAGGMIDLGTLVGDNYSFADKVSADGSVIAGVSKLENNNDYSRGFKYANGLMTDLGNLGGNEIDIAGISANGSVIVGISHDNNGDWLVFKYTDAGGMVSLGTLGGPSYAEAVSADGSVIVGGYYLSYQNNNGTRAFKYTDAGGMVSLGTLGADRSWADGVSADGSVIVGRSDLANGDERAFKYTDAGGMVSLGTLGGSESYANLISADGSVIVGQSYVANGDEHAFKYTDAGGMVDLGTLGGYLSSAEAVSKDGSVIVGDSYDENGNSRAFKYTDAGGMVSLGTLGGNDSRAYGVSADGSVIVGSSQIANGDYHAFIYNNTVENGPLVDFNNTLKALEGNSKQLNSLINAQNTLLAVSLNADCTVYGENNLCIGVGGRGALVSDPRTGQSAGNLQVGYKLNSIVRVGLFLDQGISNSSPNNYDVKSANPLAGLFAVYAPSGTNLGTQVKVSAAYSDNRTNITRNVLLNTEAGQGSSGITTQGAQLEVAYGFAANDKLVVSPFAGLRSTRVSRDAYTETSGASFLMRFNSTTQSATTAYVGAKVMGYVMPKVSVGASAGVEQDLHNNIDGYSGAINLLGDFSLPAPSIQRTRAFVSANSDYWIGSAQKISLGVYYNQQTLNDADGVTGLLSYTAGW